MAAADWTLERGPHFAHGVVALAYARPLAQLDTLGFVDGQQVAVQQVGSRVVVALPEMVPGNHNLTLNVNGLSQVVPLTIAEQKPGQVPELSSLVASLRQKALDATAFHLQLAGLDREQIKENREAIGVYYQELARQSQPSPRLDTAARFYLANAGWLGDLSENLRMAEILGQEIGYRRSTDFNFEGQLARFIDRLITADSLLNLGLGRTRLLRQRYGPVPALINDQGTGRLMGSSLVQLDLLQQYMRLGALLSHLRRQPVHLSNRLAVRLDAAVDANRDLLQSTRGNYRCLAAQDFDTGCARYRRLARVMVRQADLLPQAQALWQGFKPPQPYLPASFNFVESMSRPIWPGYLRVRQPLPKTLNMSLQPYGSQLYIRFMAYNYQRHDIELMLRYDGPFDSYDLPTIATTVFPFDLVYYMTYGDTKMWRYGKNKPVPGCSADDCNFYSDDFMQFSANGTYRLISGSQTRCGSCSQPAGNTVGTWSFNQNRSQLTIETTAQTTTYEVLATLPGQLSLRLPGGQLVDLVE